MSFHAVARFVATATVASLGVLVVACASPSGPTGGGGGGGGGGVTPQTVSAVAVGDIGMCGRAPVAQTARLVGSLEGELLLAGDLAYPQGSAANFRDCFNPSWGVLRPRWHPVPGNHEYDSPGAVPYFSYFGEAAGTDASGYYAFTAGEWLILMLNSNVAQVPASRGSAQYEFVRAQLQAQRTPCTLAVWHHPLFTSGPNGANPFMRDMWLLLETGRVEVIVNGHDHLYERFGRQTADGRADDVNGIRQFTVGTGGADLYNFVRVAGNSEAQHMRYGALKLTLRPAQVDWEFHAIDGSILDRGLDTCR
jgi:hypothetical protein